MSFLKRNSWLPALLAVFFWCPALKAQPQPPSALAATSATNSAVTLNWTESDPAAVSFIVERCLAGDTNYVAIGAPSAPPFVDSSIDGMTAYGYLIVAVDANANESTPSNPVTVGPPPVGVSLVSPYRALNFYDESQFGIRPLMVLDSNGDPAIVYSIESPNNADGSDQSANSFLEFVGWDRANHVWKTPVAVGLLGNSQPTGGGANNYWFARDASTNTWAVADVSNAPDFSSMQILVYTSVDNGATWQTITAFTDSVNALANPSLALGAGNIYLSFYQSFNGIQYLTGKLTDPPANWTMSPAPLPPQASRYRAENSLALDSAGNPGLAFWTLEGSYDAVLAFWRPGSAASTMLLDSNQIPNYLPEVKLAFFGVEPVVASLVARDSYGPTGYNNFFWVTAQTANGWGPPAGLPSDGSASLAFGSFAIGSAGQGALVAQNTGGNSATALCGNPKLSRSSDLANWNTCSPYPSGNPPYAYASWPQVVFVPNDGLYIAMTNGDDQNVPVWGVILWRER